MTVDDVLMVQTARMIKIWTYICASVLLATLYTLLAPLPSEESNRQVRNTQKSMEAE